MITSALTLFICLIWNLEKTECRATTESHNNSNTEMFDDYRMYVNLTGTPFWGSTGSSLHVTGKQVWNSTDSALKPTQNLSPEYMERVNKYWFYVGGICCTILSGFGIIGNILSIVVLATPDMKSSTSIYLILLAVFDTGLLLSNFLFTNTIWLMFYSPYKVSLDYYFRMPSLPVLYSVSSIAHTGSIFTTVAVNVERYVAVCHPLKAASFCTISKAKKVSAVVVFCSLVYNIPRYLEMYWTWEHVPAFNQTLLVISFSEIAQTYGYQTVYLVYINVVLKVILPVLSLMIMNGFMVRKLYHIKPNLEKQVRQSSEKERFTVMVVAVVVVFMVSAAVACTELILYEIDSALTLEECSEVCGYVSGASQLAVVTNSAINFVLFCFFGHKFRAAFLKKFGCCCRRNTYITSSQLTTTTKATPSQISNLSSNL